MRLFIALDLDDDARTVIAAEQKRLGAGLRDVSRSALKWVRPDHMHLTLVFLGEVDENVAPKLADAVGRDIAAPVFDITYSGIGIFPPRGRPNVLWLGVTEGAQNAIDLQKIMLERLEPFRLVLETRPFHPHLTLARWRDGRERDRTLVDGLATRHGIARVRVDHATLYQSRLGTAGPTYIELARARLTA